MRKNRDPLLKVSEVAVRLNCSEATSWRLIRKGKLPRIKVGAGTRVPVDAVDEYIASQTTLGAGAGRP